jgi:hypothetical protein
VVETPDTDMQGDAPPQPVQLAYRGVTVTVTSLVALVVIAAATANFLPSFDGFSMPGFDHLSFPKLDHLAFPGFSRGYQPKSERVAAQPPQKTASVPIPDRKTVSVPIPDPKPVTVPIVDPVVNATLKEIQSSEQQNAVVLASLTQSSTTQGNDLKRISRQLTALAVQVDALNSAVAPVTTGSIPRANPGMAHANPGVPHGNPRARIIRTARRTEKPDPPLPPPVGPVSVGGAPLAPAPATASAAR